MPSPTALKKYVASACTLIVSLFILAVVLRIDFVTESGANLSRTTHHSTSPLKSESLKYVHYPIIKTSKLQPPLIVKLRKDSNHTIVPNEPFALHIEFTSHQQLSNLEYEWIIPDGVTLLYGAPIRSRIEHLNSKSPQQVTYYFMQHSSTGIFESEAENRKIHLRVNSTSSGHVFQTSAQFNTLLQDQIDKEKNDLAERNLVYMEEQLQNTKSAQQ